MKPELPGDVEVDLEAAENAVEAPDPDEILKMLDDQDLLEQKVLLQLKKDIEETKQNEEEFGDKAEQLIHDMRELNKKLLGGEEEGK